MKFPVDLLADVSQAELEQLAHNYMNNLLYSNPDSPEHLTLSDSTQVIIDISSVGFVPLYGSSDKQKILALFSPSDPFTAVALYLLDQWWSVDNILKTADPARDGVVEVETVGERIVLYILNRVIYRAKEMSSEELPFLCHGEKDNAKIFWNNGEAVGFYSVKPSGSLCNSFSTRSYQLPVMNSIFVRKCQRGKGIGLQMLEDFVLRSKEDCLGLRYPLTKSMYKVCEKYLCQYPGDTDLLWEVESVGGPNQRTNIASKIQAMNLSALSKSLLFTEESLVISEVTEKDLVMEANTTQIESMDCTVEMMEEVTVLQATKVVSEDEVPVAAWGRSSGSKRKKMGEKVKKDTSEKVTRIKNTEAETPREEHVSAQLKTELHTASELIQTEALFNVASEKGKGEDVVDATPKEEAATVSTDKPAAVLVSQHLEEAHVTSAPTAEEQQVEDCARQDNTSYDSQITVESVSSEIEETEEKSQKEDTATMVDSEVLEVHKEAESLNKVGEVTDEKLEEGVTQHEVSISTHATSKDGEVGKTGRTAHSNTPRQRPQRHSKPEEEVKEEIAAEGDGRLLRGRTVLNTPTPKCKYAQHSQKVCEELEKEVDNVVYENEMYTTEIVEELAVTKGEKSEEITSIKEDVVAVKELREKHLDDEQLTNEEETEKQEEPGVEYTAVKGSTGRPNTANIALIKKNEDEKVTDESEKEQEGIEVETSVRQDKQKASDDEIREPPVVQKKALRGRRTVTPKPKPTKQSKRHQKQEEEHTDETDLGAGDSASEEKTGKQATDKQMEEYHQVEQEEAVNNTEEERSTDKSTVVTETIIAKAEKAAEDVIPSSGVNIEESKQAQEVEETEGETETVSMMEAYKEEEADNMLPEPDTVAAAPKTVISDEVLDEAATPVPEEEQNRTEIPKLQKATVILVDLKTTCHHLSVKEAEETPENEQMEIIATEEKETSSCVAEEQTQEQEMLVLEEEDGGKQKNYTETSVDATAEVGTAKKEELDEYYSVKEKEESANVDKGKSDAGEAPVTETKILGSGRKTAEASCKSASRSNPQQDEDNNGEPITEKEVDKAETGTVEMEGEMESIANNVIAVTVPVEENQFAVSEIHAGTEADIPALNDAEEILSPIEVDEAMCLEEEEAPVVETRALRSGTKMVTATPRHKTTRSRKQADEHEAENSEEEEAAVTTRKLRWGRISASATPKGKSTITHKPIQEEAQKGEEESKSVEETGVDVEETIKNEAVEKRNKEREENIEGEIGEKVRSLSKNRKQLQKEEGGVKKSEEEEAGLGSAEEASTEVDEMKVPEEDKMEEKEELVNVRVSLEGTMSMTKENIAGVTAAADVQGGESDTPLPKPTTAFILTHSEEEKQSKENDATHQVENIEPELNIETIAVEDVEAPVGKSAGEGETLDHIVEEAALTQDTVEREQSASTSEVVETATGESVQETPLTTKDAEAKGIYEKEEAPVIETRALRSGEKKLRATTRSKIIKIKDDEQEEEATGEKSTKGYDTAVETRYLRKARQSAATDTLKSKKTQCETKQEEETIEYMQVEETKAVLGEAKKRVESRDENIKERNEEAAEQKEEKTGPEVEMEKVEAVAEELLMEQETVEDEPSSVTETRTGGQEETQAVLKKEDRSVAIVDETGTVKISSAEVAETNSAEEEETTVIAFTEVGSDIANAEVKAIVEDESVTTIIQVVETQQQEEKTQEVLQLSDDSPENRELNAEEQAETEETLPTGQEAGPPAEDTAEDQAKETAGKEPATEITESPHSSVVEGRSLRKRMKTVADKEEDKAEEIQLPKRRSIRRRPNVDYRENDEEDETGAVTVKEEEDKMESHEDKDNKKKAECSANEPIEKLGESIREHNLGELNMGAIESTSEKESILNLVLDIDEEVKTAGISQKDKEDEQNMSEEEMEPIVIEKRVLRGRSVPTPQSKFRWHSAKVEKAEESLTDEEKNPQSAQKRSLCKRKSTEVTPTQKSKRLNRV